MNMRKNTRLTRTELNLRAIVRRERVTRSQYKSSDFDVSKQTTNEPRALETKNTVIKISNLLSDH